MKKGMTLRLSARTLTIAIKLNLASLISLQQLDAFHTVRHGALAVLERLCVGIVVLAAVSFLKQRRVQLSVQNERKRLF